MSAETTAAIVAAVAAVAASASALAALPFTARAANAARKQTELQRQVAEQANQPYVWADIRTDESQGWSFHFVVGNSGPTVATDVMITVDPPLPNKSQVPELTTRAFERMRDGIKTLAPGRVVEWTLGPSPDIVGEDVSQSFTITIDGHGPHGALPTLTYVVDLADFREAIDSPPGSVHELTRAVRGIEKKLGR